jgi:hypothetical protein
MFEDLKNNSADMLVVCHCKGHVISFEMNVKWHASIKPEVMPPFLK